MSVNAKLIFMFLKNKIILVKSALSGTIQSNRKSGCTMRILLTRPSEDGRETARLLRERGFDVIHHPLIRIRHLPGDAPDLSSVQGVLATSANGARALAARALAARVTESVTTLPLYAVGDATAQAARTCGFTSIHSADGNLESLAELVRQKVNPQAGTLLHATGNKRAGDLQSMLSRNGYRIEIATFYTSETIRTLHPEVAAMLGTDDIQIVMLYSPRTAQTYARLITDMRVSYTSRLLHSCLSPMVAQALGSLHLRSDQIAIAARPTQDDLFATLPPLRTGGSETTSKDCDTNRNSTHE